MTHAQDFALTLRRDLGGWRHYIDDADIHAGDMIEVLFPGQQWVRGRYEWNFHPEDPPTFYFGMPGAEHAAVLSLPPGARVRVCRN